MEKYDVIVIGSGPPRARGGARGAFLEAAAAQAARAYGVMGASVESATPGASAADRLATGACGMPLQGASA